MTETVLDGQLASAASAWWDIYVLDLERCGDHYEGYRVSLAEFVSGAGRAARVGECGSSDANEQTCNVR